MESNRIGTTRYALVPQHFTPEMAEAAREAICREIQSRVVDPEAHAVAAYHAAIAASPGQGAVTAEQLEAAAEVAWQEESVRAADRRRLIAWADAPESDKTRFRGYARATVRALGLTVQP